MQDLTSRIAGVDNEQMAGRAMGLGAMFGYGVGAIKEQFNTTNVNAKSGSTDSSNSNENSGGLQGLIGRAKAVINPTMNLSAETDYNGNTNPIRNVMPVEKVSKKIEIPTSNGNNKDNISNGSNNSPKSVVSKVAKTGFNATKAYLGVGAKMAEGNFNQNQYKAKSYNTNRKNNFQNTEYANNFTNKVAQKLGDENEHKEQP